MTPIASFPAAWPSASSSCWAHVRFFGKVADRVGRALEVAIPPGGCSLRQLRALLCDTIEGAADALAEPGLRMAVDQVLTTEEAWVTPGREVAFFSVFSGG